jgi:aminoglycoside 6'-N-acetyltransferase I
MTDIVRPARLEDLPALVELAGAFYAEDGFTTPREQLTANLIVLLDSDTSRVAVADHTTAGLIGFAITTTTFGLENGLIAELEDLYVDPEHRGGGLGDRLIGDSADWAHGRGATQLELVVAPNGRDVQRLHAYYLRRGFIDEQRRLISLPLT